MSTRAYVRLMAREARSQWPAILTVAALTGAYTLLNIYLGGL